MPPRINIPPVTRILLIVLLVQSSLSAIIRYKQWSAQSVVLVPYLVLVPQFSLIYPWTFLTTTLVEGNIFTVSTAAVSIYYGGRYLERAWSSNELAKFLGVVSVIPNALCFIVMVVMFALTRNEKWTLTAISGTVPLQVAFLVAFSQLVPTHTVTLLRGVISLRVPRLPLIFVGVAIFLSMTPLFSRAGAFLSIFGFLTSWTYLRFYKAAFPDLDSSQPTSLRGDASESFALAEFFPGPVKPIVSIVSEQVFGILVAMRICTPFSASDAAGARLGDGLLQRGGPPGSARAEAERRRALALKALDQRLHAASVAATGPRSAAGASTQAPQPLQPQQPQPASHTEGPRIQTQPQPGAQTAMTTQPTSMLGETSYRPDHEADNTSP